MNNSNNNNNNNARVIVSLSQARIQNGSPAFLRSRLVPLKNTKQTRNIKTI